jgi:ribosome biogenesis protein Tsr3
MPPALFFILQLPFTRLAYIIFPIAVANGVISGAFAFCKCLEALSTCLSLINHRADILYDCMHYALVYVYVNMGPIDHYAFQVAPYEAAELHAGNEEIPSCSSL